MALFSPSLRISVMLGMSLVVACNEAPEPPAEKQQVREEVEKPLRVDPATRRLAAQAVGEALQIPVGSERDIVLREISRNLRHSHRDLALEAARGMSADYEARSFEPGPDELTVELTKMMNQQMVPIRKCMALAVQAKRIPRTHEALTEFEAEARKYCIYEGPPEPPPPPPYEALVMIADALPPGETRADLLSLAMAIEMDAPLKARAALQRLRVLLPQLEPSVRAEMLQLLDTWSIDVLEQKPDAAIARVAKLKRTDREEGELQAAYLVSQLIDEGYTEHALRALSLLPKPRNCEDFIGSTGIQFYGGKQNLARFVDRLPTWLELRRLCPNGLSARTKAELSSKPDGSTWL